MNRGQNGSDARGALLSPVLPEPARIACETGLPRDAGRINRQSHYLGAEEGLLDVVIGRQVATAEDRDDVGLGQPPELAGFVLEVVEYRGRLRTRTPAEAPGGDGRKIPRPSRRPAAPTAR